MMNLQELLQLIILLLTMKHTRSQLGFEYNGFVGGANCGNVCDRRNQHEHRPLRAPTGSAELGLFVESLATGCAHTSWDEYILRPTNLQLLDNPNPRYVFLFFLNQILKYIYCPPNARRVNIYVTKDILQLVYMSRHPNHHFYEIPNRQVSWVIIQTYFEKLRNRKCKDFETHDRPKWYVGKILGTKKVLFPSF